MLAELEVRPVRSLTVWLIGVGSSEKPAWGVKVTLPVAFTVQVPWPGTVNAASVKIRTNGKSTTRDTMREAGVLPRRSYFFFA